MSSSDTPNHTNENGSSNEEIAEALLRKDAALRKQGVRDMVAKAFSQKGLTLEQIFNDEDKCKEAMEAVAELGDALATGKLEFPGKSTEEQTDS